MVVVVVPMVLVAVVVVVEEEVEEEKKKTIVHPFESFLHLLQCAKFGESSPHKRAEVCTWTVCQ